MVPARRLLKFFLVTLFYVLTAVLFISLVTPARSVFFPAWLRGVLTGFAAVMLLRYIVYLLFGLTFSQRLRRLRSQPAAGRMAYHPLVSVIIPAWNEEVGLVGTVQSVLSSSYRNVEVIVVNDGSTDGSDRLMRSFMARRRPGGIPVRYHCQANAGKARALNRGLELARGEIIATMDADSVVDPEALRHFVEAFSDPAVMAVVGTVKIGNTGTIWGLVQRLEYVIGFYFKRAESLLKSIHIIGGAAGAFRREVFETLGLFRADHITEDMELTLRIQNAGMKIVYASKALVTTEGASTLWGLMQQRLRWKRGRLSVLYEHRGLFFSRASHHQRVLSWIILPLVVLGEVTQLLELPFVLALLIHGWASGDFMPFVASVVVVGLLTAVQITVTESGRDRLRLLSLTPISWWLLAIVNYVEVSALLRSLWLITRKRRLAWQRWQRAGVLSHS